MRQREYGPWWFKLWMISGRKEVGNIEDGDDYGRRLMCEDEAQSFFFVRYRRVIELRVELS